MKRVYEILRFIPVYTSINAYMFDCGDVEFIIKNKNGSLNKLKGKKVKITIEG